VVHPGFARHCQPPVLENERRETEPELQNATFLSSQYPTSLNGPYRRCLSDLHKSPFLQSGNVVLRGGRLISSALLFPR
jgi:hypothetical protein